MPVKSEQQSNDGGEVDNSRCLQLAKRRQWTAVETAYQQMRKMSKLTTPMAAEVNPTDPASSLSVLMMACRENRRGVIELLLDLGADVTQQTQDGMTALHYAVSACSDIIVEILLKSGANANVIGGPDKQLPLHLACQRHSSALIIAKLLLKSMSSNARLVADKHGFLPITYAIEISNSSLVRELLSEHPKEQACEWRDRKTGNTLLHLATIKQNAAIAQTLVVYGKADINAQNAKGQTPLHLAAQNSDEAMAKCLNSLKASADISDRNEQTPLHIAAMSGSTPIVGLMVDRMKADVQMRTTDGSTLMHLAAAAGHVTSVMAFVKRGVPLYMPNKAGILSLHLAAKNGHVRVVRTLLENGAPINARTKERLTPLHLAVMHNEPEVIELLMGFGANVDMQGGQSGETALHIAARTNGVECAQMLLLSGAHVNATTGTDQETALHLASRRGYDKVVELLLEEGANCQMLSKSGETALHLAVRHAHSSIVKLLLEHVRRKCSPREVIHLVNLPTSEGETSLHLAFQLTQNQLHYAFEDVDISNMLLQNGADPLATTKLTMEIPLHYSCRSGNLNVTLELAKFMGHSFSPLTNRTAKNGKSPLLTACHHGHADLVEFLTQHSARVDMFDESGLAALHLAAERGFIECCEKVLEQKAFVNAKTRLGITPLHLAAASGYKDLVVRLVEKYHALVDISSMDKKTPLHLAASNGHKEVAQALVNLRANINAVDSLGQTPLHLAAESDHPDVVKMFLKYNPQLVFTATQDGMTCAHIAAAKGSVAVVKELMRFNRSVVIAARNKTSDSLPLHLAAEGGHAEVVRILIEAGSSPLDENADGMTCIHLAGKEGHPTVLGAIPSSVSWYLPSGKTGLTPLHVAAFYAKVDMVRDLLARIPPDVPTQQATFYNIKDQKLKKLISIDYGLTPLHVASFAGVDQVVRLLLNLPGVDAEAKSATMKLTALHLAAQTGSLSVSSLLLSKSANLQVAEDSRGYKPLHLAARNGHCDMVASLVGQGTDINTTDNHGWVPLHHACRCGQLEVVKLLLELGAPVTYATRDERVPLSLAASSSHLDVFMYLLGKEHNTEKLLEDSKFVFDLMIVGKMSKQQAVEEFILVSKSPLGTAARLAHLFLEQSVKDSEHSKDLEAASRFCEKVTSSLMSIGAVQSSPTKVLQATDFKGRQFIDALLDDNLKTVVAESAVQRYLTDIWGGNLDWSSARTFFLFLSFVIFPPLLVFFSLPLKHGYYKVPIIKFMGGLASHIQFLVILGMVAVVPLHPLPVRDSFLPTAEEYLLALWLGGNLTAELTNTNGGRNRQLKVVILGFSAVAFFLQILAITYDLEAYEASILMYIRNIIFSIPVLLSVFFVVDFLTFHEKFGPLTIILFYIIEETVIATIIMLVFFIGWWLQLQAIYSPLCPDIQPELTDGCICNVRVPPVCEKPFIHSIIGTGIPGCRSNQEIVGTLTTNFQLLYGALLHHGENIWQAAIRNSPEWAISFARVQMSTFHIIMVLTILTIIISTSADTYERMNRRSDLEWKYERAKLIRNIIKTSPMPSPFNLLVKPLIYLRAFIKHKGLLCTKFAPFYMTLEEEIGDNEEESDEEGGQVNKPRRKLSFAERIRLFFTRRHSRVSVTSASQGVTHIVPTAGKSAAELLGNATGATKHRDKNVHQTLVEVINWYSVVERYRELEDQESEDEYIEELGCNLSELDEWQAELWEEAEEVEEEEEREIFRKWLIEEFKEVIKS